MDSQATKVHIDLPNHWAVGGESLWATALGADRYRIDNVPFHAYDLNFGDVVEAIASAPELKPSVLRVLERSGHQTMRVFFTEAAAAKSGEYLAQLKPYGAEYERSTARYVALDLEPGAAVAKVREILTSWSTLGVAEYETCEARVAGSFDDAPSEDED
jgi:hypothetical protein